MNCPREPEVLDALIAARWPDACDGELRAHADSCALCADLVLVASSIAADAPHATVPTSGVVWWKIQRRERQEAALAASRTITIVQASSIVGAIALVLTILGGVSAMTGNWRTWLARAVEIAQIPQWNIALLCMFLVLVTLGPVALYLAVSKE